MATLYRDNLYYSCNLYYEYQNSALIAANISKFSANSSRYLLALQQSFSAKAVDIYIYIFFFLTHVIEVICKRKNIFK